jgi:flagellar hook-associated protein 1
MKALFEIARSGMTVAERSLATTAHNLVNANTPGYSRQRVENTPIGQRIVGGHVGLGVNIGQVNRLRSTLIDAQLHDKRMDMGYMGGKAAVFEQLEATMASDMGGDLDQYMGRLFDAFSAMSADPQDVSIRNAVLSQTRQLTTKFNDMSRSLDVTVDVTELGIQENIHQINMLVKDLAALNESITLSKAKGTPDYTSLDIQVQKLEQLSQLVGFETMEASNGSLEVRIGGILVVSEDRPTLLEASYDGTSSKVDIRLMDSTQSVKPTGGRLLANIEMLEKEIPTIREELDALASTLVDQFNSLHQQGFGLDGDTGLDFFDPAFTDASSIRLNSALEDDLRKIGASSVLDEAGNGQIAADIAAVRNQPILNGRKLVEAAINVISRPGSQLAELRSSMGTRDSEIRMLEIQQEQEAGVSIDEELAQMIHFQNAYQGSARVMASAQQMYDTLISLIR